MFNEIVKRTSETSLHQAVRWYLETCAGTGHTLRAKGNDLRLFLSYFDDNASLAAFTRRACEEFRDHRVKTEANATVRRRLSTLAHFGKSLEPLIPGFVSPVRHVRFPELPQRVPQTIPSETIKALRTAMLPKADQFVPVRDQLLFELYASQGFRNFEPLEMSLEQCDVKTGLFLAVKRKGWKVQDIVMHERVRALLPRYLVLRDIELATHDAVYRRLSEESRSKYPFIVSTFAARPGIPSTYKLSTKSVWRQVRAVGQRIDEDVHPHLFRHSFAKHMLESLTALGDPTLNPLAITQKALGHSSPVTTMIYIDPMMDDMRRAMKAVK